MSPPSAPLNFQGYVDALRALLATTSPDARSRHAVGALVARMKRDLRSHGARAVVKVARAVGEDVASLYRYATIAERWTAPQVEALLRRSGRGGRRLTWSHLVVAAPVEDPRARARLLDLALREGLSVRQLQGRLPRSPRSDASDGPDVELVRAARAAESLRSRARRIHSATALRPPKDPASAAPLERAIAAYEAIQQHVREELATLRALRGKATATRHRQDGHVSTSRVFAQHIEIRPRAEHVLCAQMGILNNVEKEK